MKIIRSKRRSIALIIDPEGNLTVRAPIGFSQSLIDRFLRDKSDWIKKNQSIIKLRRAASHQFHEGESFYYLGNRYPLVYRSQQVGPLILNDAFYLREGSKLPPAEIFTRWYKSEARKIIPERVAHLARNFGFTYNKVRITSARTRWGSCSSKKNLSFSWRLIMASLDSIDYVIIHELVHLEHPNHSRKFWERLQSIMPDYKSRRAWLKQNVGQMAL